MTARLCLSQETCPWCFSLTKSLLVTCVLKTLETIVVQMLVVDGPAVPGEGLQAGFWDGSRGTSHSSVGMGEGEAVPRWGWAIFSLMIQKQEMFRGTHSGRVHRAAVLFGLKRGRQQLDLEWRKKGPLELSCPDSLLTGIRWASDVCRRCCGALRGLQRNSGEGWKSLCWATPCALS